jgi:membrane protein
MKAIDGAVGAADRFQRRRPALGLPVAVLTKFNDDQAGNLAALIAYYGFVALFPLFLLLTAVLDILLRNDPHLRTSLLNSALAQYPVIGQQIKQHTGTIPGSGLPFLIGALFLLFGARGIARAMQNALCEIWGIPRYSLPEFFWKQLWGLALILSVGAGFIVTTFLSGLAGGAGRSTFTGVGAHVGAVAISLVLNFGMFWLGFRLATMRRVRWHDLRIGAGIAAVAWTVLQLAGGYVVSHQLQHTSELYGTFGVVLGLLAWLYLQAVITVYAAEVDVVLAKRLWPRSLLGTGKDVAPVSAATASDARASDARVPDATASHAAAASEPARPGVPGPRHAREDRTGSTVRGDGKAGTGS